PSSRTQLPPTASTQERRQRVASSPPGTAQATDSGALSRSTRPGAACSRAGTSPARHSHALSRAWRLRIACRAAVPKAPGPDTMPWRAPPPTGDDPPPDRGGGRGQWPWACPPAGFALPQQARFLPFPPTLVGRWLRRTSQTCPSSFVTSSSNRLTSSTLVTTPTTAPAAAQRPSSYSWSLVVLPPGRFTSRARARPRYTPIRSGRPRRYGPP